MPIENQAQTFELNGSQPAPLELLVFVVGEHDWVAAIDEAGARLVLEETNDEEPGAYSDWGVDLVSEEQLDTPWCDEGDRTEIIGTLREWLTTATKPTYLVGTE
ncbi:hypothetical protein [Pseudomonas antarctica]|uniref:hypothetical protein n=1 Tax=Pseudomonas antarctica TaxID=219572 RepID=UPI00387AC224